MSDTRQRLLDAAQHLFVKNGISGTSLRAITKAAGTNLASVNYHFGSKDHLIHAVFARRLGPVNSQRLKMIDRVEQNPPVCIEAVLEAFLDPPFRMFQAEPKSREFPLLITRLYAESEELQRIIFSQFDEVKDRFTAAFQKALPDLPAEEMVWRRHFLIGAMAHTFAAPEMLKQYAGVAHSQNNYQHALKRLIAFVAAGMRAPVPDIHGDT